MKFTFKCEQFDYSIFNTDTDRNNKPTSTITIEANEDGLDGVLNQFTSFLRACGYQIDGYIDVVNDDFDDTCDDEDFDNDEIYSSGVWPFPVSRPEEGLDATEEDATEEDGALPFANYGGERCPNCGLTRQQMGQNTCFDSRCGLGLNRV